MQSSQPIIRPLNAWTAEPSTLRVPSYVAGIRLYAATFDDARKSCAKRCSTPPAS